MNINEKKIEIDKLKADIRKYMFVSDVIPHRDYYIIEFSEWQEYNGTRLDGIRISTAGGKINALKRAIEAVDKIDMLNNPAR